LAYKPNVDDLRESPAVKAAQSLVEAGADVIAHEPFKKNACIEGLNVTPNLDAALEGSDALVLLVAHDPLLKLDPQQVAAMTPARLVVDTVNGWDPHPWQQAGFTVLRLGVGRPPSLP
jgi:UDP-N-acetyl-D-mannosaminuronate dehydrogenase